MTTTRAATLDDVPALIELMTEFYAESGFTLLPEPARASFEALIADPRLGGVWIAEDDGVAAGHVVLTLCFAMEYGGLRGFIDDLFVRPGARGRGHAASLLAAARGACAERGVRALNVEVGPDNDVAQRVYRRAGFEPTGHDLLFMALAAPSHAVE